MTERRPLIWESRAGLPTPSTCELLYSTAGPSAGLLLRICKLFIKGSKITNLRSLLLYFVLGSKFHECHIKLKWSYLAASPALLSLSTLRVPLLYLENAVYKFSVGNSVCWAPGSCNAAWSTWFTMCHYVQLVSNDSDYGHGAGTLNSGGSQEASPFFGHWAEGWGSWNTVHMTLGM